MRKKLKATEVFTPGSYPHHTYVERSDKKYEERLEDALSTPGQVVSLSGPSKSGKTVLVERVVGDDALITVTGAGIETPDDLWVRILDWMDAPAEIAHATTVEGSASLETGATGGLKVPGVLKGEGTAQVGGQLRASRGKTRTHIRTGMRQVIQEIANSDFVVLVDDFHYMPRTVQEEVAKQIKEAARQGVKMVTASVTHRSDDVVRANPELRGRVMAIDLEYWSHESLGSIAQQGFAVLDATLEADALASFCAEAAGSPQLMQAICLNACFELDLRDTSSSKRVLALDSAARGLVYERTAATTDFRSLVDVLDSGPPTRGTERKQYRFVDGSDGDVYRCVLKAVSADPPTLSFRYDDIQRRVKATCRDDEPYGSSIITTCTQMCKLALDRFARERVIDWDEQKFVLDIADPYLLFYLRWSGRLLESGAEHPA
jgi:hypothetical protein